MTTILLLGIIGCLLVVILAMLPRSGGSNEQVRNASDRVLQEAAGGEAPGTEGGRASRTTTIRHTRLKKSYVAIVIDDAGNDLDSLKPFLHFKGKLTVAVLPKLPYSTRASDMIAASGKEVILHLPMEPLGTGDPGPGTITVSMTEEEIARMLEEDFSTVPHAVGINNHMGSLATQDPKVMDSLFAFLKKENKFFIDSKTINETKGREFAGKYAVPFLERNFFLDTLTDKENIRQSLAKGIEFSRLNGYAVLIGHVQHPDVLGVIEEEYVTLTGRGVVFVTVSELLEKIRGGLE